MDVGNQNIYQNCTRKERFKNQNFKI